MKLKFAKTLALAFIMVCSMSICQPAFATSADIPMPINSNVEATTPTTAPSESPAATEKNTADGQGSISFSGNGVVTTDSTEIPVEPATETPAETPDTASTGDSTTTQDTTDKEVSVYVEGPKETLEVPDEEIPVDDSDLATVNMETGEITPGVTSNTDTPQQTGDSDTTETNNSSSGSMTLLVAVTGVMLGIAVLVAGFMIVRAVFSKKEKDESDD